MPQSVSAKPRNEGSKDLQGPRSQVLGFGAKVGLVVRGSRRDYQRLLGAIKGPVRAYWAASGSYFWATLSVGWARIVEFTHVCPTVEARKLKHGRPPTPNRRIKENQHNHPTYMFQLFGTYHRNYMAAPQKHRACNRPRRPFLQK